MTRCFKGRFLSGVAAQLGLKRCHGSDVLHNGVKWAPCQYLDRCLGREKTSDKDPDPSRCTPKRK